MTRRRALFACDLDSQVFGALPLARAFEARGWEVAFALHAPHELPDALRARVAERFETFEAWLGELAVSERVLSFDAVGVFATGSRIARFRHDADLADRARGRRGPALFSGFNGLVFERFEEGAAWRLGCDVVALNGPRDRDAFLEFARGTPFERQPLAITGLRRATDRPQRPVKPPPGPGARPVFVFAEQVAAPSDPRHRAELAATLARLARASPRWRVVVKLRVRANERTFHEQAAPMERLIAAMPDRPPNLELSHAPLEQELETADLFATVSSTALFDALDHGVPSCVTLDFGVRNAYGTHALFASGLGVDLSACATLDDLPRREPDARWLERVGYDPRFSPDALIEALERLPADAPRPPQLQSFERSAAGEAERAGGVGTSAIAAARGAVEAAIAADDRPAAEAALARLGEVLARSDARHNADAARRRREGALAAFARRRRMYWLYRGTRNLLTGEAFRRP